MSRAAAGGRSERRAADGELRSDANALRLLAELAQADGTLGSPS